MVQKYAELFPQELEGLLLRGAPIVWPWGALEWHGSHLPLGLDGITAEAFAESLADRIEGVLLPTCWLPITTLPHPYSLSVSTETMRGILYATLAGLSKAGVKRVLIVTGHYAQGHEVEMYEAALRAQALHPQLRVFAATPLELLGDNYLDHAGRYEASQLLAIRPGLVQRESLPATLNAKLDAVLGEHPSLGSVQEGVELLEAGLESWIDWIESDKAALEVHYAKAKARYQDYIDKFYRGSWEDAINAWWAQK